MPHLIVLLVVLVVGVFAALALAALGVAVVGNPARRVRAAALFAASAAVLVYLWGIVHLAGAVVNVEDGGTGSSPPVPCRAAGDRIANRVVDYDVGYLPLRFVCRLDDGTSYASPTVPPYVNPAALVLVLAAGVLAAVPSAAGRWRSRPA